MDNIQSPRHFKINYIATLIFSYRNDNGFTPEAMPRHRLNRVLNCIESSQLFSWNMVFLIKQFYWHLGIFLHLFGLVFQFPTKLFFSRSALTTSPRVILTLASAVAATSDVSPSWRSCSTRTGESYPPHTRSREDSRDRVEEEEEEKWRGTRRKDAQGKERGGEGGEQTERPREWWKSTITECTRLLGSLENRAIEESNDTLD